MRHYLINFLGEFFMYWQTSLYMTHYLINSPNKKVRPVMSLSMMVKPPVRTKSGKCPHEGRKTAHYPPLRNYFAIDPSKTFRAMITRISRNPARNNFSDVFWRNDEMAIAQINSCKHATNTVKKQRATIKLCNRPETIPQKLLFNAKKFPE